MPKVHDLKYSQLLEATLRNFEIHPLRDFNVKATRNMCLLRHDVDHDIGQAVEMATIEKSFGVSSTYFVLHTEPYYHMGDFGDKCRLLVDFGHEVGLHNNIITQIVRNEPHLTAREMLRRELAYLRGFGIDVVGTSSHGDKLCYELDYVNYQIFAKSRPRNKQERIAGMQLHTIELEEEGLLYEAYSLREDLYISDSGCNWSLSRTGKRELEVPLEELDGIDDVFQFLDTAGKRADVVLQLLAHPCWYKIDLAEELMAQ